MLLAQTFSKGFIVVDYYTNTAAYAEHCVNKDKPWMHCNGKCQMMKKMQQEDKKDQDNPERKVDNKNEVVLSSKSYFATVEIPQPLETSSLKKHSVAVGIATGMPFAVFHPPQL